MAQESLRVRGAGSAMCRLFGPPTELFVTPMVLKTGGISGCVAEVGPHRRLS